MFNIGLEIREMRIDAGLTQQNVADLLMWDISKISKIENNKLELKVRDLRELERIFKAKKVAEFVINNEEQDQHALLTV